MHSRGLRTELGLSEMSYSAAADDTCTVYSTESDRIAAQNSLFRGTYCCITSTVAFNI